MTKPKTQPTTIKPLDFINAVEHPVKKADGLVIFKMIKKLTGLKPKMWGPSIIGFGSYHYKYDSGHEGDAPMIAFSPRKTKQVLYVLNNFKKQDILLEKLGKHKTGKICLYINKLADIDMEVLEEIINASWKKNLKEYGKK